MKISIVIPTYNRYEQLRNTLAAIARQTFPLEALEVIVVDDGSVDNTHDIQQIEFPFRLVYIVESNNGATCARNTGAQRSNGEVLVFMDDDIELLPDCLTILVRQHTLYSKAIVLGTLLPAPKNGADDAVCGRAKSAGQMPDTDENIPVPFSECFTGLLSIRSSDFFCLGMFQDPSGGWPNWDDVDFGYRAHLAGYRILRNRNALAIHHDYTVGNISGAARRWYRASQSAVRLFQKFPEIRSCIPMYRDKTPIDWSTDSPRLIARKLARKAASSWPVLHGMERVARLLEERFPSTFLLRPLYRWISGGYMYQGYNEALKELSERRLHNP
jgi:glycosyltransferase involved in cell wall biosynthesis